MNERAYPPGSGPDPMDSQRDDPMGSQREDPMGSQREDPMGSPQRGLRSMDDDLDAEDFDAEEFDPGEFDTGMEGDQPAGGDQQLGADERMTGLEGGTSGMDGGGRHTGLDGPGTGMSEVDLDEILGHWRQIQAEFVDEPRQAVQDADNLVLGLLGRLTEALSDECRQVEAEWSRRDQVSTEELRMSLQRYRLLFERLIAV